MRLQELGLRPATLACLRNVGICTLHELLDHSCRELIWHSAIAPAEVHEILQKLNKRGLTLQPTTKRTVRLPDERNLELFRLRVVEGCSLPEAGEQLNSLSPRVERVLAAFPKGLTKRRRPDRVASPAPKQHGNYTVERAVLRVLADGQPEKLSDIRAAVERVLGQPVSMESVSWCLRTGSRKETPKFKRPARGFYQLAPQT